MKAIVVSDTHRDFNKLRQIVEKNLGADLFIHLGDGENEMKDIQKMYPEINFVYVKGSSDYGTATTTYIAELGGYKIFCTHGHLYNVHDGLDSLVSEAKANDCKIALYGHTHLYKTELIDGVYVMNPGSLHSPRGTRPPSYGFIDIDENANIVLNIIAVK